MLAPRVFSRGFGRYWVRSAALGGRPEGRRLVRRAIGLVERVATGGTVGSGFGG
jgi:hypothetical protein